jgi:acyl-CoA synthetase (AMP-forming)/AMP-acid ligase II
MGPSQHPFLQLLSKYDARPFLQKNKEVKTYLHLEQAVQKNLAHLASLKEKSIAILIEDLFEFLVALIALEYLGKRVIVLSPQISDENIQALSAQCKFEKILTKRKIKKQFQINDLKPTVVPLYKSGEIILTTSGSTGTPKGVLHSWQSLLSGVSISERGEKAKWLLTYDFISFAGMQVILHALLNGAQLVEPGNDLMQTLKTASTTHISATPSFWRKLLVQVTKSKDIPQLKHITLGGEAVSQELLNRIAKIFPGISITQIYASTEMGACFYVKDKKAGLSNQVLESKPGPVQAKIVDGELYLKSQRAMRGYLNQSKAIDSEGWYATGDMVELKGDRIYFAGRRQEIINVGGFKVYPQEVEEVIYSVPGVLHARVSAQASGVLGQLVRADIEIAPNADKKEVQDKILETCQKKLARPKVPRILEITSNLVQGSKIKRDTHARKN